jgi:predicted lipid-binding transport protein (Tim44 family)
METTLEAITLVIFAAIAAVVLFQLYNVLGKRVGRQPEDVTETERARLTLGPRPAEAPAKPQPQPNIINGVDISPMLARDPGFDARAFLDGARSAYETIVRAYAAGDRATLKDLLAPAPAAAFAAGMDEREKAGRTETVEFVHPPRADLEGIEVLGDNKARAQVRFLAELRTTIRSASGEERTDERRTAESWTFERVLGSADPNWTLIRVDPATV